MTTPILFGVASHFIARALFSKASEMATTKMKVYPDLKRFLNGRTIVG